MDFINTSAPVGKASLFFLKYQNFHLFNGTSRILKLVDACIYELTYDCECLYIYIYIYIYMCVCVCERVCVCVCNTLIYISTEKTHIL